MRGMPVLGSCDPHNVDILGLLEHLAIVDELLTVAESGNFDRLVEVTGVDVADRHVLDVPVLLVFQQEGSMRPTLVSLTDVANVDAVVGSDDSLHGRGCRRHAASRSSCARTKYTARHEARCHRRGSLDKVPPRRTGLGIIRLRGACADSGMIVYHVTVRSFALRRPPWAHENPWTPDPFRPIAPEAGPKQGES